MPTPDISVIQGTPNSGTENSNVLIRSVDPRLHFYKFNEHPLASLILSNGMALQARDNSPSPSIKGKQLSKKATSNIKFEWIEDDVMAKRSFKATAAVAANATSLTVSSADDDYFRAGDALLLTNASGQTERVVVSSVAANTLNVVNPDGSTRTAGIAMTVADEFYLQENARAEDSTAPEIRTTKAADMYNYCEIISEPYGVTRVKQIIGHYQTKNPMGLEKMKAFSRLMEKLEHMLIFGTRAIKNSTTNPTYYSGGLKYFLELYSDVEIRNMAGKPVTRAEMDSFLSAVCKAGSPNKVALCDSRMLNLISSMGYEHVQVNNYRVGEIGQNIKKIFGPMGEITLVHEPLFDNVRVMNGSMMVLDLNDITIRFLEGNGESMDIRDEEILLADGSISKKGQYIGALGAQYNTLKHFAWFKNAGA